MEVINPILIKSGKEWRMKEFNESGTFTWTVPESTIALFLVFGGGGNTHSSYKAGAGSGHMASAWVTLIKGETVTATIASPSTTNGAGGQASSLKINTLVVSASGGNGVSNYTGSLGGSGGGAASSVPTGDTTYSYMGGVGSYGGGGAGSGCFRDTNSPARGANGGTYGGGGGAGGRQQNYGGLVGSIASGGNRGDETSISPSKDVLSIEKEVGANIFLGAGGMSGEDGYPTSSSHVMAENASLVSLMKPIIDKYFPGKDLAYLYSSGGKATYPVSGGGGGAGIYSAGGSTSASYYVANGLCGGCGGGGGGGLIGYPGITVQSNGSYGGGGGAGFFSNPSCGQDVYGGRGTGVFDPGGLIAVKSYTRSSGGFVVDNIVKYGLGGIAFILY